MRELPGSAGLFATGLAVDQDAILIIPRGDLDIASAPQLQQQIDRFVTGGRPVVLDLSQLDFIDSTGLKVLLRAWQESKRNGGNLRLRRGNAQVMRVFELTSLLSCFEFED